jgi:hypothetical protein
MDPSLNDENSLNNKDIDDTEDVRTRAPTLRTEVLEP